MKNWRYYLRLAGSVVDLLPTKEDRVLNTLIKGVAILDVLHDEIYGRVPIETIVYEQAGSRRVQTLESPAFSMLFQRYNLGVGLQRRVTVLSAERELWSYQLGEELLFIQINTLMQLSEVHAHGSTFWFTEGFPMQKIFQRLWNAFPHGINLEAQDTSSGPTWSLSSLEPKNVRLSPQGEALVAKLACVPLRRTYLAIGTYGTGKTTLLRKVAERRSNKCLRFTIEALQKLSQDQVFFFIDILQPDFVLIDDFDRLREGFRTALLLELLERFQAPGKPSLGITVNHTSRLDPALLRAGRIDEIIDFELPGTEERSWLLEEKLPGHVLPEERNRLIEATEGFTPAEIINLCENCRLRPVNEALQTTIRLRQLIHGRTVAELRHSVFEVLEDGIPLAVRAEGDTPRRQKRKLKLKRR